MSTVGGPRLSTIPTFQNTYSLDFDGVDDYVSMGNVLNLANDGSDAISISLWLKTTLSSLGYLVSKQTAFTDGYGVFMLPTGEIAFYLGSSTSSARIYAYTQNTFNDGDWHNVVITYDGSQNVSGLNIYVNNTSQALTVVTNNTPNNVSNIANFAIGMRNGDAYPYLDYIDEVAVFDKVLTPTEITSISAAPTDLTDLSPIAWYRMGDNGSYKSPQWLLPNNENKDKVSNYSLDFDGVDETIFCGIDASRQVQTLTMSVWVKPTAFARDGIVLNGHVSYGNQGIEIYWNFNQFGVRINGSTYGLGSGNGQNNWSHILVAYDGNTLKRMTNGVPLADVVIGATINYTNYNGLTIGRSPYGFHIGNIDEFAFWNSDQSANFSTIYGTGVPNDLTDLSPIAWYRMGEEATFSGGVWTVPDQVGSNDGTSNAMTIEDRVGSAPSSSNNAVSFNMDLIDRVEDTP